MICDDDPEPEPDEGPSQPPDPPEPLPKGIPEGFGIEADFRGIVDMLKLAVAEAWEEHNRACHDYECRHCARVSAHKVDLSRQRQSALALSIAKRLAAVAISKGRRPEPEAEPDPQGPPLLVAPDGRPLVS
jgi:hypothetical protein